VNAARWLAAAAGAVLALVAGGVVSEEVRGRLDRLPFAVLRLARGRLPAGLRERVHDQEWVPELEHILKHAELLPLTRLVMGLRYAAGLLVHAGTIADALQPAAGSRAGQQGLAARSAGLLHALLWPEQQPLRVRLLLTGMAAAAAAATGIAAAGTAVHARDLELFAVLAGCGLASYRSPRQAGKAVRPKHALIADLSEAWVLPAAVLLPPVYALLAPVPVIALHQWRHRVIAYRWFYTLTVHSLVYGLVSGLAHAAARPAAGHLTPPGTTLASWIVIIITCGLLAEAITYASLLAAIKTALPATRLLPLTANRVGVRCALASTALGTAVTLAAAVDPLLVIPLIPAAVLLSRHLNGTTAITTPAPDSQHHASPAA
jgi:hypothetical protein